MTSPTEEWRQHFPTYRFEDRDIVLKEYESAARSLEADERVFLNAANVTLLVAAGLGSLIVGSFDRISQTVAPTFTPRTVALAAFALIALFVWTGLRYFADRQKAIVFAARKVIVLRRMLGISYGRLQLVLPSSRIEGADQPFAVRLFPGWTSYAAYPFWIIAGFSTPLVVLILGFAQFRTTTAPLVWNVAIATAWLFTAGTIYRSALFDTHERRTVLFSRGFARLSGLRLVDDFEYVLYRATLARYEMARHRLSLDRLKAVLVFIEDQGFYSHRGVTLRGMARAMWRFVTTRAKSGGSTITQQLVRTLFVVDIQKTFRRKLLEINLALWLDRVIDKDDLLELYIASVRFEHGVHGVLAAMQHFFGRLIPDPTPAEAFVLIERVANVRLRMLGGRIQVLLDRALSAGVLSWNDLTAVIGIYDDLLRRGLLVEDKPGCLQRLAAHFQRGN